MYQRRYDKVYLMLKQETTGYSTAWGSCVMEIKNGQGTLQISVQGLLSQKGLCYKVYGLLAKDMECTGIFCGDLALSQKGQCDLTWAFDPDDMGDGYQAEDLFAVAIITEQQGRQIAPLVAYFGQKREWLSVFCPMKQKADIQAAEAVLLQPAQEECKAPTMTISPIAQQEPKTEEEPEPEVCAETVEQPDVSYHGNFRGLLKKFREEMETLEEMGVFSAEEKNKILGNTQTEEELIADRADALQNRVPEETEYACDDEIATYTNIDMTTDDFFKNHEMLYPFGDGKAWYRISLKELLFFDTSPLSWQKDAFFLLPYHRYGHLILRQENEDIWFGLPDIYDPQEKLHGENLGFSEFLPIEQKNGMGYWIGKIPAD